MRMLSVNAGRSGKARSPAAASRRARLGRVRREPDTEGLDEVTQPRTPCVKLVLRFQRPSIVREFARAPRSGFYCLVLREGDGAAGDPIVCCERAAAMPTVAALV